MALHRLRVLVVDGQEHRIAMQQAGMERWVALQTVLGSGYDPEVTT
jgi:hypothetical protein